jgi:hypothetical protein
MAGNFACRVVAAIVTVEIDARNLECLDARTEIGMHGPCDHKVIAVEIRAHAAREPLLVLGQSTREPRNLVRGLTQFARIDPHRVHWRADGERLTEAVGNRSAMRADARDS